MLSPTAGTAAISSYTTIPISGSDVISRSFQNLSHFLSRRRPWSEFLSLSTFDLPSSLSAAVTRFQRNSKHFGLNYGILVTISAAISLIATPMALIVYALLFVSWLVLFVFREDPMVVWDHNVDDRVVIVGLVSVSVFAVWVTGMVTTMLIGASVGLSLAAVHGFLRNPDGLFLDEADAVENGLIRTPPPPPSPSRRRNSSTL